MILDDFAKNYLNLGLRINKHIQGYVEHYYGPPEIKNFVDDEGKISPKKLLQDCRNLMDQVKDQGFEEKRLNYFEKTLIAIETILRKLKGEIVPYLEQIEKLFDFKPKLCKDDFFFDLSSQAEQIYKGDGTLSERIELYVQRRKISPKLIKSLMLKAIEIAKKKTQALFPDLLPDDEKIFLNEVNNKSWAMYNWYLGNFHSRMDINVNRIYYWTSLLFYASHEGYPGHQTESAVRDQLLFRKKGHFETSILLIY
ncbi:MAG: hypothetical protein ACFFE4_19690 [Candidatus Thorarchaeota archaeon]